MRRLESTIEKKVVRWADRKGILHTKLNLQGRRGWPDRCFWLPGGCPVLVEFKRPGEKLRRLQQHIAEQLEDLGYDFFSSDDETETIGYLSDQNYIRTRRAGLDSRAVYEKVRRMVSRAGKRGSIPRPWA